MNPINNAYWLAEHMEYTLHLLDLSPYWWGTSSDRFAEDYRPETE